MLALGGVFQAAQLARDIARNGSSDATAMEASRNSLFAFEADSVEAIYGGVPGLALGLRTFHQQLQQTAKRDIGISRCVVALIHLADRLMRSDTGMQQLHGDLTALHRRNEHFELSDSAYNEQLAQIYQDRISMLGPRIMIAGEPLHLQNSDNAAGIRVALLAGVRAAVLWRQTGGKKWQLILRRRAVSALTRELIDSLPA